MSARERLRRCQQLSERQPWLKREGESWWILRGAWFSEATLCEPDSKTRTRTRSYYVCMATQNSPVCVTVWGRIGIWLRLNYGSTTPIAMNVQYALSVSQDSLLLSIQLLPASSEFSSFFSALLQDLRWLIVSPTTKATEHTLIKRTHKFLYVMSYNMFIKSVDV